MTRPQYSVEYSTEYPVPAPVKVTFSWPGGLVEAGRAAYVADQREGLSRAQGTYGQWVEAAILAAGDRVDEPAVWQGPVRAVTVRVSAQVLAQVDAQVQQAGTTSRSGLVAAAVAAAVAQTTTRVGTLPQVTRLPRRRPRPHRQMP